MMLAFRLAVLNRPHTALGISSEKDGKATPPPIDNKVPIKRRLHTRHSFDGVTINVHFTGPKVG
jgi:hypothetical protein